MGVNIINIGLVRTQKGEIKTLAEPRIKKQTF